MTAIPHSNRISIRDFLARRGIQPKYERSGYGMYLSPLREERTPSFKVDYVRNLWYDFGLGEQCAAFTQSEVVPEISHVVHFEARRALFP